MEEISGIEDIRQFRYDAFKRELTGILMNEEINGKTFKKVYLDVRADEDKACFVAFKNIIG